MNTYRKSIRFGLMLTAVSFVGAGAYAAAPTAGSVIGNQATATYQNAAGDTVSVTSNKVETIVQQVAGVTLTTDASETVAVGGKVFLPHTITNDGNGSDVFDLTAIDANTGDYDFTDIKIYPDANFDGIADSTTPITVTPTLASAGEPGSSFGIVIEATVPSTVSNDDIEDITVTATSQFDSDVNDSNTDDVTITDGPVTEIVKSMVVDKGADGITGPGDVVTITLRYSNTGLADANALVVTDALNEYLSYTTGTAYWSDDTDLLTEADDGGEQTNGSGHNMDFEYISASGTVEFEIDTVPTGRTGHVTFQATIAADAPAGEIPNIATQTVDGAIAPNSNRAVITVEPVYRVTAADALATSYQDDPDGANLDGGTVSSTDDDGAQNDIVEENSDVSQGGSVTFEFVLTNMSNGEDSIEVDVDNTSFPAGTTFQVVGSDGITPVVGPLGPLAEGESTTVSVIATLPPDATATAAGATNYEAVLSAQSVNGGPVNTATGLFTGAVTAAAVDLQNQNTTGDGTNPLDPDGNPWIDNSANPGEPVTFPLTIENLGPTSDTYNLTLEEPLPEGWTVTFLLPDGTPVTNTGVIPAGEALDLQVVITPPEDALPLTQDVVLGVMSPTSGQGDTLVNSVTVNEVVDIAITSDQTVQGAPGGIVDIPHVIENQGNVEITEGALSLGGTFNNFSGTLFHDVNGDGVVDPGDVVIDNIDDLGGLDVGESASIILRTAIPSTGAFGIAEVETVEVAESLNNGTLTDSDMSDNSVEDLVRIVSGDVALVKEQAVDPACDGTVGAFTQGNVQAQPGQCVRYRITATNTGTDEANLVTINDTVPTFTTLHECGGACSPAVTPAGSSLDTVPADGATGPLQSSHNTLIGGDVATMSFTVKVDE